MIVIMLEWQNRTQKTAQNSSKCYFHSSSPVASRLFLDLAYEGALCWLWASSSEYSFHIQPWFLLSGTELQNLNGIHNEMPGYFSAKRSNVQKISNWKSLQWKHIEICWLLFPFLFPIATCSLCNKSSNTKANHLAKLKCRQVFCKHRKISRVTNQHEITSTNKLLIGVLGQLTA